MNIKTHGQIIRVPKPKLLVNVELGIYAFECDHKRLGIRVLGNSRKEARDTFVEAVHFELNLTESS